MKRIIIGALVVSGTYSLIFIKKWGWLTAGIIMLCLLVSLAITSGAIGFLF